MINISALFGHTGKRGSRRNLTVPMFTILRHTQVQYTHKIFLELLCDRARDETREVAEMAEFPSGTIYESDGR